MMSDFLTDDTKTIILLCGVFGKEHSVTPLTQVEYSELVRWLISSKMRPEDLLQKENIAKASIGSGIDKQRLEALLGRGVQLGFAIEQWQRNGIWIISRSDSDYPARYKKHLKDKSPPLLFGVGDRALLAGGGVAIVGSRNVDKDGELFVRNTAELCAVNRMPVVSGGARGVDQFAMTAALEAGGVTIGILAENLLKKSLERNARHAIAGGRLLLISPYHPNARFTVGTAMSRNKLIYAIADYGLIVSAEHKKGGTWAGAKEELKRENSLPVFVRLGNTTPLGNSKLLELGAIAWPEPVNRESLKQQLDDLSVKNREKRSQKNLSLFDYQAMSEEPALDTRQEENIVPVPSKETTADGHSDNKPDSVYEAVLPVILNHLGEPVTPNDLSKSLEVTKTQLNTWLKKAVDCGIVRKLTHPVRYEKINNIYSDKA